jgi:AhpD family alkylhydroperoxidase
MPFIRTLPAIEATSEVQDVYAEFSRRMNFSGPPNFSMTQGHSLAIATGTWALVRNVLVTGKIERWIKELLFAAISKERNCQYCAAAHIACCRMLGLKPELLDIMVRDITSFTKPKAARYTFVRAEVFEEPAKPC